MRARLTQQLGAAMILPLALVFCSCEKSPPVAESPRIPDPAVSANATTSRPVPRRTLPLVITNLAPIAPAAAITNTPPVVSCGVPQTLPCSSSEGLPVTLSAHVDDAEGNPLAVTWTVDGRERETQQVTANAPPTSADVTVSYTLVPGDHAVKVTVSDGKLTNSCETTVTVQKDTQPPVIVCPRDISVRTDPGHCSALVTFNLKVTDNCPDVGFSCEPASGAAFPIGSTVVNCTARDAAGNVADCAFEVVVQITNRCPRNDVFWRQNPSAWPLQTMALGNQVYSRGQLLPLLRATVSADVSLVLARQLIVATLNTASGSDPRPVCGELAHASDTLSSFAGKLPYRVSVSSLAGRSMQNLATILTSYNNGMMTGECVP